MFCKCDVCGASTEASDTGIELGVCHVEAVSQMTNDAGTSAIDENIDDFRCTFIHVGI